jgi:hypothetical protein
MASMPLVNLIVLYYAAMSPWPAEGGWSRQRSLGNEGGPDARF